MNDRAPLGESGEKEGGIDRRTFLRRGGIGAGTVALSGSIAGALSACAAPAALRGGAGTDVVVIGAGAFGGWTALNLVEMGASVTLVDLYGPGNSRSTSGDETRGIRTGYAGRDLWTSWARRAIERWREFDDEWAPVLGGRIFFSAGNLVLRPSWEGELEETRETWDRAGVRYESLDPGEVAYRWPQLRADGLEAAVFEPDAGVARSRAACLRVAEIFRRKGGEIRTGRATLGSGSGGRLFEVDLEPGFPLGANLFVFALGPWFPTAFPELMAERMRIPMGHVFYWGTPPGDDRFSHPRLPSWSIPGVTGWPTYPPDHRGFRVRTGGRPGDDPDTSDRWIPEEFLERPREVLAERFPDLLSQPVLETRACHYESSVTRDWFIDRHPQWENVWLAGGGSAEGFKFGPVLGEFIASRVLGGGLHPELEEEFRLGSEELGRTDGGSGSLREDIEEGVVR